MPDIGEVHLDDLDLAILSQLEDDGRKSFSDIASKLDVTVSTISTRVKRLTDRKILTILGFLNPYKIGINIPATIYLNTRPGYIEKVAEDISNLPEVTWVAVFTGDFDVLADIHCWDVDHLTEFITKRINHIEGVEKMRLALHLRRIKLKQPSVALLKSNEEMDAT